LDDIAKLKIRTMTGENNENESTVEFKDEFSHRDRFTKDIDAKGIRGNIQTIGYDIFGEYFRENTGSWEWVEDNLIEAHIGTNVDLYMSKTAIYTIVFTVVGFLTGLLGGFVLIPLIGGMLGPGVTVLVSTLAFTVLLGGGTAGYFLGKPMYVSNERKRRIDATIPFAITFMYALSRGGMDFIEILTTLSESEDAYGEVAREVQPIVNEMENFSTDFQRALRNAGRRTPSQNFEDFMDDLISVFDSGADLTNFLEEAAQDAREQAEREQQNFIQVLELMGEVYVTVFVAGPLFLIIITVVMQMLGGGGGASQLYGIIYGLLPVMNVGFFVLINVISMDEGGLASTLESDRDVLGLEYTEEKIDEIGEYDELENIRGYKKSKARRDFINKPFTYMIDDPNYSLPFTIPVAILVIIVSLITGAAVPSVEGFVASPVINTTLLVSGPLLIMMIPYTIFHEIGMRRNKRMMSRLPEALKQLASANSIGLTLTEALTTVSRNTSGRLGDELEKVSNDIQWNYNVNAALIAFANRLRVPVLTRTIKLITKANESSGDIEDVLEVAATDVMKRYRLDKERKQQMMMYTVVVLISFTVYLFVIVLLDVTFLARFAEIGSSGGAGGGASGAGGGGGGGALNFSGLPIGQIRLGFFHSAIVQSLGSGLLAGQLGSNNVKNGMKFSVILMILSTIIFYAVVSGTFDGII